MKHPYGEVQAALTRLLDALCTWERETGRRSVLILREDGGFVCRAESGKPLASHVTESDADLLAVVSTEGIG